MAILGLTMSLSLAQAGCGSADDLPTVVADRTACSNCKMLVSEVVYATAFRVDGEDQVFDDLGCMLDKLSSDPTLKPEKMWVRDQLRDEWIPTHQAHYVYSKTLKTPMGFGYAAYADRNHAEAKASEISGETLEGLEQVTKHFAQSQQ
jgi:copper chaperone NosL